MYFQAPAQPGVEKSRREGEKSSLFEATRGIQSLVVSTEPRQRCKYKDVAARPIGRPDTLELAGITNQSSEGQKF